MPRVITMKTKGQRPEGLRVVGEGCGGGDCGETEKGEKGSSNAEKFSCM
jgi:hypothetical protein